MQEKLLNNLFVEFCNYEMLIFESHCLRFIELKNCCPNCDSLSDIQELINQWRLTDFMLGFQRALEILEIVEKINEYDKYDL